MFNSVTLFNILIITQICSMEANYDVPGMAEDITGIWELNAFASIVRDAVRSVISFPWDLGTALVTGKETGTEIITKVITLELPLIIPAGLGILAALLVPLISICFCCCCCGNSRRVIYMKDIRTHKASWRFVTALVILIAVGILGAIARTIPMSGHRLQKSPGLMLKSVLYSTNDLSLFLSTFVQNASDLAKTELNSSLEGTKTTLQDLPNILSTPLTDVVGVYMSSIENHVDSIAGNLESLSTMDVQVNSSVDGIITYIERLKMGLDAMNDNLTQLRSQCVTDGESFCSSLPRASSNPVAFNTSQLTDLASMISSLISGTDSVNLTGYMSLGNDTFAFLPTIIQNASSEAVDGMMLALDGIPATIVPQIDAVLQNANFSFGDFGLDSFLDPLTGYIELYEEKYGNLVDLQLEILGGYIGLIAITALAGLLIGCCKSSLTKRTSVGHCGARFLICSVLLSVFVAVLLLLGSVFMLVGGNLTFICKPIQDLTAIEKLVDSGVLFQDQTLGEIIFQNPNMTLSVKTFIQTCRDGGTVYTGLNLGNMLNLSSMFNTSSFVPVLGTEMYDSINETIQGISVVDSATLDNLTSQLVFPDVSGANLTQLILTELMAVDLIEMSSNLTLFADSHSHQDNAKSYRYIAQQLLNLNPTMTTLKLSVESFDSKLDNLNVMGNQIQSSVAGLSTTLGDLQVFIKTQATQTVIQAVDDFMNKMLDVPDQLVSTITARLSTDVGQCQIIGEIYDMVTGSVCVHFLNSFNVFWASFYMAGVTCIVLMIAGCKMNKYFRCPEDSLSSRKYTNPSAFHSSEVTVSMTPKYKYGGVQPDASNNARHVPSSLPSSYYHVVKERFRRRRGRFSTGSGSPQLLKIRQLDEHLKIARQENEDIHIKMNENSHLLQSVSSDTDRCGDINNYKNNKLDDNNSSMYKCEPLRLEMNSDAVYNLNEVIVDKVGTVKKLAMNEGEQESHTRETCIPPPDSNTNYRSEGHGDQVMAVFSTFKKVGEHEFTLVPLPRFQRKENKEESEETCERMQKKKSRLTNKKLLDNDILTYGGNKPCDMIDTTKHVDESWAVNSTSDVMTDISAGKQAHTDIDILDDSKDEGACLSTQNKYLQNCDDSVSQDYINNGIQLVSYNTSDEENAMIQGRYINEDIENLSENKKTTKSEMEMCASRMTDKNKAFIDYVSDTEQFVESAQDINEASVSMIKDIKCALCRNTGRNKDTKLEQICIDHIKQGMIESKKCNIANNKDQTVTTLRNNDTNLSMSDDEANVGTDSKTFTNGDLVIATEFKPSLEDHLNEFEETYKNLSFQEGRVNNHGNDFNINEERDHEESRNRMDEHKDVIEDRTSGRISTVKTSVKTELYQKTDTDEKNVVSKSRGNVGECTGKVLDIAVKPCREPEIIRSPPSVFRFWKNMDEATSDSFAHTWPLDDEQADIISGDFVAKRWGNVMESGQLQETWCKSQSYPNTEEMTSKVEDTELSEGYTKVISKGLKEELDEMECPDILQNLAVDACSQLFAPSKLKVNTSNTCSRSEDTKDMLDVLQEKSRHIDELVIDSIHCIHVADVDVITMSSAIVQPQSLSVLSSKALLKDALCRCIPPVPPCTYESASTRQGSNKTTYL